MIYQDAYGTIGKVKKYGCYMSDYVNAHELQTGEVHNQLDLNEFYEEALERGIIDTDCYINSAYNFCAKILGWDIKAITKVSKDYVPGNDEIVILLMRRYAPGVTGSDKDGYIYHFVLERSTGKICDPIEQGSITAREGRLHTKRVITLNEASKV